MRHVLAVVEQACTVNDRQAVEDVAQAAERLRSASLSVLRLIERSA
jgi:hypothetical protein